jgi:SAM-dependent methyltransferase/uncharacterized protein YbaR (Trm112 family)
MKPRLLDLLVCPVCGADFELRAETLGTPLPSEEVTPPFPCRACHAPSASRRRPDDRGTCADCYGMEVETGALVCAARHSFPVREGVPRLTPDQMTAPAAVGGQDLQFGDAARIRASFDREWKHFDYGDRTWARTVEERKAIFLQEVDLVPDDLVGRVVLEAGCGNGTLARALNDFGCEVVAADVSEVTVAAHRHFAALGNGRTHFVQADVMNPPFKPGRFDVVYASGVLPHTPDTRQSLAAMVPAVAPRGRIYVWIYWRIPGLRHRLRQALRAVIAPLSTPAQHAVLRSGVALLRAPSPLRRVLGRTRPQDDLSARERLVRLLDHYTPRYRWEHTPTEVEGWLRGLGFDDLALSDEREWGFGVVATRHHRDGGAS